MLGAVHHYPEGVPSVPLDLFAYERPLIEGGAVVVGLDEVGRGALAGPLTVGAVAINHLRPAPAGLTDSKLLTPARRERLVDPLKAWATSWALGSVSSHEIDEWGLRLALAVAATRALDGLEVTATHALIDGSFNLLRAPVNVTFGSAQPPLLTYAALDHTTVIKGDQLCATIGAASILAKVARDHVMVELDTQYDGYGWVHNKGYGAPDHLAALRERGPSQEHRLSWRLPKPT